MKLRMIIVGAGKTGKHVIRMAIKDKHEVYVIEKNEELAKQIAADFDCKVIVEDATSMDTLKEAGAEEADALVTTTEDDSVNLLVIMQGKELGIKNLVSSVADDGHIPMFERVGASTVENPHRLNGEHLYRAMRLPTARDFMQLGGDIEMVEFLVDENADAEGKTIAELEKDETIPESARIIILRREDDVILPKEDTKIKAGDVMVVVSKESVTEKLIKPFKTEEE